MISILLLCLAPLGGAAQLSPVAAHDFSAVEIRGGQEDPAKQYSAKRKEAGKDPEKLWELYLWCEAYGLDKQGRSCLRAVVKANPDHKEAHEKLGHLEYAGRWFPSQKKLDKFKAKEELRIAEEEGLVRWKDGWVKLEDLPFLERGMALDENGEWVSKEDLEKQAAGWVKQDLVWVSPDEIENMEKGLWKCGDKWLDLDKANEWHSKLERMWKIPGDYFLLYTTCDRDVAMQAMDHMDRGHRDMARIIGGMTGDLLHVAMLRNIKQYGVFAAGSERNQPTEMLGLSSIHHAYYGELWFDADNKEYHAGGVGYWDASTENGSRFGPHAARHAATLSMIEAVDPSPESLKKLRKKGNSYTERFIGEFYKEKNLPQWFRYGAASYVERYFVDQFVGAGGNANWPKDWSVSNIAGRGGLRPLKDIFSIELAPNDPSDAGKLLNERGLLVAFALDGKCAPVANALGAVKAAIRSGKGHKKAIGELELALLKHGKELRAFAGL